MNAFDAFSGIGGFHKAISLSTLLRSVTVTVASDVDSACKTVYQRAFGKSISFADNIFDIGTDGTDGINLGCLDVVLAGFPCQPFANVGKKGGLDDPRAKTFSKLVDILKAYRPRYALLENVQKLTSFDRGGAYAAILRALEGAGYHVDPLDLCATDFGLPQQRRRLYFACTRKGTKPSRGASLKRTQRAKYPTTWHLLEKRMPTEHLVPRRTSATVFRRNMRWEGDLCIDRALARPICATMGKWHRANQDNYYSESYLSGPRPERHHRGREYREGEVVRRITPLEGLRLQGFPDSFLDAFDGISHTTTYRLIGNAVAVPVARAVLEWMIES